MEEISKVSPAFEQVLSHADPDEKRDAIVLFSEPQMEVPPLRGRLRVLSERLEEIERRAAVRRREDAAALHRYQSVSREQLGGNRELQASMIGKVLPVAAVEVTRATLPTLAADPRVVAVMPNQAIHLIRPLRVDYQELGNQETRDHLTWGLKELEIPKLWEMTRGEDIRIAVLDTGVYGDHPALKGRVEKFVIIDSLGRRITCRPSFDCGSHGTHVCGTIAGGTTPEGVAIGVAPGASLCVGGVLVGDATVHRLLEGISWALTQRVDIISLSVGFHYYEPLFTQVFQILIDHYGVLPIVAIGNSNHGNSDSPGNAYNALSVGAVEKAPDGALGVSFFSSGASMTFPGSEPNALVTKPDVVAPGAQVYSCIPPESRGDATYEYTYMDGTSMATPHVAGVAALLMAAKPDAPIDAIVRVLRETAHHPGGPRRRPDNRWGWGMIRPVDALRALS